MAEKHEINQDDDQPEVADDADIYDKVRKWNARYDGGNDALEFLERMEELAQCGGVPLDRLTQVLPDKLRGRALEWYRNNRHQWHSWADFRADFRTFFLPRRYRTKLEDEIRRRTQGPRETGKDFITSISTMFRHLGGVDEHEKLERIYDNLRPEYRHYVRPRDFRTLPELITLIEEFEELGREHIRVQTHGRSPNSAMQVSVRNHRRRSTPQKAGHHKHNVSYDDKRIFIPLTIYGTTVHCLIDTGAVRTFIGDRVAQLCAKYRTPRHHVHISARVADGRETSLTTEYNIKALYNGEAHRINAVVFPSLAEDIVLGMDTLTCLGMTISLKGPPLVSSVDARKRCTTTVSIGGISTTVPMGERQCNPYTLPITRTPPPSIPQPTRSQHAPCRPHSRTTKKAQKLNKSTTTIPLTGLMTIAHLPPTRKILTIPTTQTPTTKPDTSQRPAVFVGVTTRPGLRRQRTRNDAGEAVTVSTHSKFGERWTHVKTKTSIWIPRLEEDECNRAFPQLNQKRFKGGGRYNEVLYKPHADIPFCLYVGDK